MFFIGVLVYFVNAFILFDILKKIILMNMRALRSRDSMPDPDGEASFRRWWIFALCATLFILSQFWRLSSAVIADDLSRDLGLSPEILGLLGGAFFYSFGLAQLPMGPMLDRFGAGVIMGILACIGAASAFLFAFSDSSMMAVMARAGIGIGMAAALMGSYKIFTTLFSPHMFATVSGLLMSLGQLGGICATFPLVWLSESLGWRGSFICMAGVTLITGVILYIVIGRDDKNASPFRNNVFAPLCTVLKSNDFWRIAPLGFASYGTLITAQGLWGGPYLMHACGLSKAAASSVLLAIPVGIICSSPVWGHVSDKLEQRKKLALFGQAFMFVIYSSLAMNLQLPYWLLILQFWLLGVGFGSNNILYVQVKETFSLSMAGTALTGLNFFVILGAASFQHMMGAVMNNWPLLSDGMLPAIAYQWGFGVCACLLALAILIFSSSRDTSAGSKVTLG